jgi:hypothetical protein
MTRHSGAPEKYLSRERQFGDPNAEERFIQ